MFALIEQQDGFLHYRIEGKLSREDLGRYYQTLSTERQRHGARLHLLVEAVNFSGYASAGAFLKMLGHEWRLLRHVDRYALMAEGRKLRLVVRTLGWLNPVFRMRVFDDIPTARNWLQAEAQTGA